MSDALPPGFSLDPSPSGGLPPGFTLDQSEPSGVRDVPPKTMEVPTFVDEFGNPGPDTRTITRGGYEDHPSFSHFNTESTGLPVSPSRNAALLFGYAFADSPESRWNIIRQHVPGAQLTADKYGNPLVAIGDKKYHIAHPGASADDLTGGVIRATAMAPLAAGAAMAAPASIPIAAVLQAGAGALGSLGMDAAANAAGAKQEVSGRRALESGLAAAVPPVIGGAISRLAAPAALSETPAAVKSLFAGNKGFASSIGKEAPRFEASDLMLHDPVAKNTAKALLAEKPFSPAAAEITQGIQANLANAPLRIARDVDTAFGPMPMSERHASQALLQSKKSLSPQLSALLESAPEVDPSGVVAQIDKALQTAPHGSPTQSLLRKARGMLVKEPGEPGAAYQTDPATGAPILGTGSAGKPDSYVTDARTLENARLALDRIIKFGDSDAGINPGVISPQDFAIGNVRKALSETLKSQVPKYADTMGKYSKIYSMLDANEQGAGLFSRGQNALRPDQVAAMAADPETGAAFRVGARAAIQNKLATNPNDVAALRGMTGGPGDYTRENLETLFGSKAVEGVQATAAREAGYGHTAAELMAAHAAGKGAVGSNLYEQSVAPLLSGHPIEQAYSKGVRDPVNAVADFLSGRTGADYSEGFGKFLTMPRNQGTAGIQQMLSNKAANVAVNRNPATAAASAVTETQPDRPQRAAGGRTGIDHASVAAHLVRSVEHVRRAQSKTTEPLLKVPDEAIARSLAVANQGI